MIGGVLFDTVIIDEIERSLGTIKDVTIYACRADTFALKGNSNEKLFHHFQEYHATHS